MLEYQPMNRQEGEQRSLSPEELQATTRETYSLIPEFYSLVEFVNDTKGYSTDEIIEAMNRYGFSHGQGELRPMLVKKFDDLIVLSATTPSFRKAIHSLIESVCFNGRTTKKYQYDQGATNALVKALQLDNDEGVYTPEGAEKGELVLYGHVLNNFALGIKNALWTGNDPMSPETHEQGLLFPVTLAQYKDFILDWFKQFTERYGKSPSDALMFQGFEAWEF